MGLEDVRYWIIACLTVGIPITELLLLLYSRISSVIANPLFKTEISLWVWLYNKQP